MLSKDTFKQKFQQYIFHKDKIKAIKRASKQKFQLPEIPESLEKIIDDEIDLFRDKDLLE